MRLQTLFRSSTRSSALALLLFSCSTPEANTDWPGYLGGPDTNHYSPLTQINKENVHRLQVAWTYRSGDADPENRSQIQCNPLIIDGVLYGTSPKLKLFALDAATGQELWAFDPFDDQYRLFGMGVNRGLAYWTDGSRDQRIFFTAGSYLYAVQAQNGQLIRSFGSNGAVDLHDGLGRDVSDLFVVSNTPGIVFEDLLILGTRVSEDMGAAPGHVRAYDVRTGEIRWIFHTIPQPGEFGYDTWPPDAYKEVGGANAWSGFSLDPGRGIVFVPTGSASYDFYGGDRHGENLFANCVIALNTRTGERIWHFQTVHHDLWDRDLPAPPNVVTVQHEGKSIDAVAQITKSGYVFLFDRESGEPLFQVEERAVPPSTLIGEEAWPTQPIPVKPPPFARNRMTEADITKRTMGANLYVKMLWSNALEGEPFIPPSEEGTILFPGFDGGGEWGGAAFDPETGHLIINASEMPWIIQMLKYQPEDDGYLATRGRNIYNAACVGCHGVDLKGASIHTVPSLVDVKARMSKYMITTILKKGKGMMPAFAYLSENEINAVAAFLLGSQEKAPPIEHDQPPWDYPYVMNGYRRFKDQDGYPAITPPWGTLNAIDLNKGEIAWKVTLGEHPGLTASKDALTGCENYGGPVITAGGLIFIAATLDEKFRAFDKRNGAMLWETKLPAAGYATPSIYAVRGKQYIVIAAGGGKLGTPSGDAYVAFSLPNE